MQYQERVVNWLYQCFSKEVVESSSERNQRFLEESLELIQSTGLTEKAAHKMVEYVYSRPIGEPYQEVGGVMNTLAALCYVNGLSMEECGNVEMERIEPPEIIKKIREKQKLKPKIADN